MLLTLPEVVMAENKIQFQKGLSVSEFMQRYGTDEQCHKALEKMKWPHGYECENCGHKSFSYIKSRKLFQCNRCKHQTTVIRKTVFHSTNLPLTTWFLAMYFITQCKNGISSMELMKHLGVSYKTAWKMRHKLMQVMVEQDVKKKLMGLVQVDDAYLGGHKSDGKRGRGSENKQPIVVAVEVTVDHRPLYVKLSPVRTFSKKEIEKWSKTNLDSSCYVVTDGFACFNAFSKSTKMHLSVPMKPDPKTGKKPYFKWVNTILGNVKTSITGTYRSRKDEYTTRYLAEFQYRINRRFDLRTILSKLIYASAHTPPLPMGMLRKAANYT
jgi:ribosomal protein L37AE/L43A